MAKSEKKSVASPRSGEPSLRSVGLKTLAEHLGLSVATVSRVLTAAPAARSIPQVTQDRVFAAAAALIALATTNTHQDPNEAQGAEPQADSPLAAAAPEPISKEI